MPPENHEMWLLAGPNGSGKSTFYLKYLSDAIPIYVNPDEIAKSLNLSDKQARDLEAMRLAEQQRRDLMASGKSFVAETVFSHPSKVDLLRDAKAMSYTVRLVFICTDDPDINKLRVQQRVEQGGHTVPVDKIVPRYERALQNLRAAITIADTTYLYDNSTTGKPHHLVAKIENRIVEILLENIPRWVHAAFPEGLEVYLAKAASDSPDKEANQ